MGKAYSEEQRARVRELLEARRDEESIEKETGVSDRTIRRWKLELERTGRIGKPPESRTGRHRVLSPEVEAALFEHVKKKPDMSVDDMLWWLYENFQVVVGTRTVRRVFERKGVKVKVGKSNPSGEGASMDEVENLQGGADVVDPEVVESDLSTAQVDGPYTSPYAPVPTTSASSEIENQLRQAIQQQTTPQHPYPALMELEGDLPDDEETIQLQLQQIALQKREVELKLKMRRMRGSGKGTPSSANRSNVLTTPQSAPSSLFNPAAALAPTPPKRDSRSKKKIEESKRRTEERKERMLRDLERRSRRRDHLTAEWVQSKDIWPLRAQEMLADLMHQFACYTYTPAHEPTFDAMYRDLYQIVDHSIGDWNQQVHDEMLRERMKRKMGQLRAKMQKTGEIVPRTDGYPGFQKAEGYTGDAAGATVGDESEIVQDPALHAAEALQAQAQQQHDDQDVAGGVVPPDQDPNLTAAHHQHQAHHQQQQQQQQQQQLHYEAVPPDPQQLPQQPMSYPQPIMHHQGPPQQYGLTMEQHHNMLPYAQLGTQQGLSHQESMVM